MRYIPHTEEDIREMLAEANLRNIEDLFSSIPKEARLSKPLNLPPPLSEPELINHLNRIGSKNTPAGQALSFLGAGSYQHHTPAAVPEIIGRSEWATPYTPYQPEISQGTLQAIFEYQTIVCNLTGMEVANASHYDGATATAEAAAMSINITKRKKIIISSAIHPEYRATIKTILKPGHYEIVDAPFGRDGRTNASTLNEIVLKDAAAVIVQSPNFFGVIEDLEEMGKIAKAREAMFVVTITDPVSLGILESPGAFGADIVTAEGQAFGGGLNYGGPYLGILATREKYLRLMPGRIVGATTDLDGKRGFVLTISTREQHIRREKAMSNICSNEALLATTAAMHLSLLGKEGLKRLAETNLANAEYLKSALSKIDGVNIAFIAPTFNEFTMRIDKDVDALSKALTGKGIFAGVPLECWYPELKDHLLICTTECHTKEDMDRFINALKSELKS